MKRTMMTLLYMIGETISMFDQEIVYKVKLCVYMVLYLVGTFHFMEVTGSWDDK